MTPIKDIIRKIRIAIHAEDCINYDDRDVLNVINAGLRVIRRTIAEIQPELIMETTAGLLQAGEDLITLQQIPLKIIELTAGDKVFGNATHIYSQYDAKIFDERPLEETTFHHIQNRSAVGKPRRFYRVGMKNLKVHPKPEKETAYTLRTVDDIEELKFHDTLPLMKEFEDFLIEYASTRLALSNEYDMQQEQQILANIHTQITQILMPPPAGVIVKGYW